MPQNTRLRLLVQLRGFRDTLELSTEKIHSRSAALHRGIGIGQSWYQSREIVVSESMLKLANLSSHWYLLQNQTFFKTKMRLT